MALLPLPVFPRPASEPPLQQQGRRSQERLEELWEDLFENPSHWWDNRISHKRSLAHPDFRHKASKEPLWLDNRHTPPWVDSRLPSLHVHQYHHHHHNDDEEQQRKGDPSCPSSSTTSTYTHDEDAIQALCERGHLDMAMDVLSRMYTSPSSNTYMSLLKACIRTKAISHARRVHSHLALHSPTEVTGLLGDYLVVTLAKCGAIEDAIHTSARLPHRTVFSWTAIISAFVDCGYGLEALKMYQCMLEDNVEPNNYTFVSIFQACGSIPDLEQGRNLHAYAGRKGFTLDVFVGSSLVSMYGKCGAVAEAEDVFSALTHRDIVSWTAMLSAYVEQGQGEKALKLYRQMPEEGARPNQLTFLIALQACATLAEKETALDVDGQSIKPTSLEIGKALHADARRMGYTSNILVSTALVSLYSKCGTIVETEDVFSGLSRPDIVSWNVMLSAYVELGQGEKGLQLYTQMLESVTPDELTLTCILQACSETGSLEICKQLHFDVVSAECDWIPSVAATLIHAYGHCASMVDAHVVFDGLLEPNIVVWNACIAGHSGAGNFAATLHMFEKLNLAGIEPNESTFISVLSACSHTGLVVEGLDYFEIMTRVYGITADLKHYAILVDLLGRAGDLKRIENMLGIMPMQADLTIWLSLLGACRTHANLELAKHAFGCAVNLQPKGGAAYVLMSNI